MFDKRYGYILNTVPTIAAVKGFAWVVLLGGLAELSGLIFYAHRWHKMQKTQDRYTPFDSCAGMEDGSLKTRWALELAGCLIFGFLGVVGLGDNNVSKILPYCSFLFFLVVERCCIFLWDLAFIGACGWYPLNMMETLVFWPVEDLPITERKKEVLQAWSHYEYERVNEYLQTNLILWYFLLTVAVTLAILFFAAATYHVVGLVAYGPWGFGPHYDLGVWLDHDLWGDELGIGEEAKHPLMQPADFGDGYGFDFGVNTLGLWVRDKNEEALKKMGYVTDFWGGFDWGNEEVVDIKGGWVRVPESARL